MNGCNLRERICCKLYILFCVLLCAVATCVSVLVAKLLIFVYNQHLYLYYIIMIGLKLEYNHLEKRSNH